MKGPRGRAGGCVQTGPPGSRPRGYGEPGPASHALKAAGPAPEKSRRALRPPGSGVRAPRAPPAPRIPEARLRRAPRADGASCSSLEASSPRNLFSGPGTFFVFKFHLNFFC